MVFFADITVLTLKNKKSKLNGKESFIVLVTTMNFVAVSCIIYIDGILYLCIDRFNMQKNF